MVGVLPLEPGALAIACLAVIFAGLSKGGFGGSVGFLATPLLALVLDPGAALGLMLPLLMLMDLALLRRYRGQWDPVSARVLIAGAVPGVALGALLYRQADPDLFRLLIGGLALGFVAWQLARSRGWLARGGGAPGPLAGAGWGMAAGFTSFVSHAGGPPAAIYLLSRGLTKTAYQATSVLLFWAINSLKFVPFLWLGIFTRDTALADLVLAPVALLGAWAGVRLHHRLPERLFFAIAHVALVATGLKLIWDALA